MTGIKKWTAAILVVYAGNVIGVIICSFLWPDRAADSLGMAASFMCQGKMPLAVRERYEKDLLEQPLNDKLREMIANFDQALSHPEAQDLADLTQWAQNLTM